MESNVVARVTLPSSLAIIREWEVIPELPENATFGILRNVPLFVCEKNSSNCCWPLLFCLARPIDKFSWGLRYFEEKGENGDGGG